MASVAKFPVPNTLDEAIDLAAKHLPQGFRCQLTIERGGYGFQLISPTGEEYSVCSDDNLRSHFTEHLELALELASQGEV